ncbi:MAG: PilN domain-containing protein [Planctomycetota bacterium]
MPNRNTLLLITGSQLARVDVTVGKNPRVQGVWTLERLPGESIATLADAALRLGPKKCGEVFLLCHEFWTGVIHLASDVAGALDGDELDQAIALEAETYSGVSAFESRLGTKPLPRDASGESRWWVTQVPQADWNEVNQAVQQFGGKLAGIGHPSLAAFPSAIQRSSEDSERERWRLNQAFGESTLSISGVGSDIRDVIALGDLKTQRTRSQLLDWCNQTAGSKESVAWVTDQSLPELFADSACAQVLLGDDVPQGPDELHPEGSTEQFFGEEALRCWAEAIVGTLQSDPRNGAQMPIVIASKPPMSSRTAMVLACCMGVLVAVGCVGVHLVNQRHLTELNAQIDKFNATKKSLSQGKSQLQKLDKALADQRLELASVTEETQKLLADLAEANRVRNFQRTRWVELVSALAKANDGSCWVRGLETHNDMVKLTGLAASNHEISAFATNLERYASPHGWKVHPAQTERNDLSLIEFEVSLEVSDREVESPDFDSAVVNVPPNPFAATGSKTMVHRLSSDLETQPR